MKKLEELSTMKIKFGIHKGKQLKDIPDSYLQFLIDKEIAKGKLLTYCYLKLNIPIPEYNYKITVTDAVQGDGIYYTIAVDKHEAINKTIKDNNIICTQSFDGTSFRAEKI